MLYEASLQVSYSGKKVASVTHFPRETLRAEKMDESGKVKNYYYAPDWTEVTQTTELTKIPVFGTKGTGNEIFIIKGTYLLFTTIHQRTGLHLILF